MANFRIGSGNHDKAWNDPPKLSFKPSNSTATSSNRLKMMKKRVPIPINNSNTVPVVPSLEDKPAHFKSPPVCVLSKNENLNSKDLKEEGDSVEDSELLENVLALLTEIYDEVAEHVEDSLKEDIKKRIANMKEMWLQDKLHNEVKIKMKNLAVALKQKNHTLAWTLHQSLIVDYTSDCATWMIGIKTLIAEARQKNALEPSKLEKENALAEG